jgi:hypothetical protein
MMRSSKLLARSLQVLALSATSLLFSPLTHAEGLVAYRVGRAETIANGTIENAVILVEGSKIVTIGEDLPIERGIPIIDRPDWVVIPGLVNAYSRLGLDGTSGSKPTPAVHASAELYPADRDYEEIVKYGVTTLGLYPAGSSIPGQAVAVRPLGSTGEEMTLADDVYLKIILRRNKSSKKQLMDGFAAADKHLEKVAKAKEKWDKEQEKKKKKKSSKKKDDDDKDDDKKDEDDKKEDKKDDKSSDVFTPPEPDPSAEVFLRLRDKSLKALVSLGGAAEYLHFLDALGEEDIDWSLRLPLTAESNFFYVFDQEGFGLSVEGIGEREARVLIEPRTTRHPGTMRERNMPAELSAAGAKLVFIPMRDDLPNHKRWLGNVSEVVAKGLDRDTALRALTLEPAEMLGLAERLGSLEVDKDANMVFLDGDPFESTTSIEAVMIEGDVVYGEVNP